MKYITNMPVMHLSSSVKVYFLGLDKKNMHVKQLSYLKDNDEASLCVVLLGGNSGWRSQHKRDNRVHNLLGRFPVHKSVPKE